VISGLPSAKSQLGAGPSVPLGACVFVSVLDQANGALVEPCRRLIEMGFSLVPRPMHRQTLKRRGFRSWPVNKLREGRPIYRSHSERRGATGIPHNRVAPAIADSFSLRRTPNQRDTVVY